MHELPGELVALGGAIRNLARMDARRCGYPLTTLHGYTLSLTALEQLIEQLRTLPLAKRIKLPGLRSDRADIILPGALVARAIMQVMGVRALTVSVNGLREGLFFEHFWRHWDEPIIADIRSFGVLNLARIYHYQKKHANHVRFLASRVFEQLTPLHGYGAPERELLDAAALLHDIGAIIAYENHDVHSQTLIV
ncbi:MAG: Ppx/GppA family phosphatase, partial [Candidatus Thermofonsia Clade 3 bacterium]